MFSEWTVGHLEGLIPICGGLYFFLIAKGVLPKKPKNPEQLKHWRDQYGKWMRIGSVIIIVFGLLQLLGLF